MKIYQVDDKKSTKLLLVKAQQRHKNLASPQISTNKLSNAIHT